jgi:hypothetical protein
MAAQKERRAAPRKPGTSSTVANTPPHPPEDRREPPSEQPAAEIRRRIEVAAYLRAKQRGFAPGYELDDWLKAEAEVRNRPQS